MHENQIPIFKFHHFPIGSYDTNQFKLRLGKCRNESEVEMIRNDMLNFFSSRNLKQEEIDEIETFIKFHKEFNEVTDNSDDILGSSDDE